MKFQVGDMLIGFFSEDGKTSYPGRDKPVWWMITEIKEKHVYWFSSEVMGIIQPTPTLDFSVEPMMDQWKPTTIFVAYYYIRDGEVLFHNGLDMLGESATLSE